MNLDILEELTNDGLPSSYLELLKDDYLFDVCKIVLLSKELDNGYVLSLESVSDKSGIEDKIKAMVDKIAVNAAAPKDTIYI